MANVAKGVRRRMCCWLSPHHIIPTCVCRLRMCWPGKLIMGPKTPNFGKGVSQIRYNDSFACPCYPLVNSNNTGTSHNVVFAWAGTIFSISVAICCGNVVVPNFEATIDNPSSVHSIFCGGTWNKFGNCSLYILHMYTFKSDILQN